MTNKTCGECKHLNQKLLFCRKNGARWLSSNTTACLDFEAIQPPTNGDVIKQMSNEELAHLFENPCPPEIEKHCGGNDREQCERCWLDYLNAPAESGGGK